MSPTLRASSTIRISGSTFIATENASRAYKPEEYVLNVLSINFSSSEKAIISGILLCMYLSSYVVFRKNIFTLFSIIFGTWLFFSLTSWMVSGGLYFNDWSFYEYRLLAVGLAYMLIGYNFSKNKSVSLSKYLYAFGIFGFLGAALSLGGWKPEQNMFWVLIYPLLAFGTLLTSVYIKSKSFLTWGTLFLMAYILKITSEYFGDSLGWPLALVIAGLAMIGAGYMSISLKNKYLSGGLID